MGEVNNSLKSSHEMGRYTSEQELEMRREMIRNRSRACVRLPDREKSQRIEDLVQMYNPSLASAVEETDIDAVDESAETDTNTLASHSPQSSFYRSSSSTENLFSTPPRSLSTMGSSETLEARNGTSTNDSPTSSLSTSPYTSRPNSDLLSPKLEQLDKEKVSKQMYALTSGMWHTMLGADPLYRLIFTAVACLTARHGFSVHSEENETPQQIPRLLILIYH